MGPLDYVRRRALRWIGVVSLIAGVGSIAASLAMHLTDDPGAHVRYSNIAVSLIGVLAWTGGAIVILLICTLVSRGNSE